MNGQQIKAAIKVAELGSITKAAQALFTTPQGVRYHVDSLEEELGCKLFFRSPTGCAPTPSGKVFLSAMPGVIHEVQGIVAQTRAMCGHQQQALRLLMYGAISIPFVDNVCTIFRKTRPDVALRFVDHMGKGDYYEVRNGYADICVGMRTTWLAHGNGLRFERCEGFNEPFICIMNETNPFIANGHQVIGLSDLAGLEAAVASPSVPETLAQDGFRRVIPMERNAIADFCQHGGVVISDGFLDIRFPGMRTIPLDKPCEVLGFVTVQDPPEAARAFVSAAQKLARGDACGQGAPPDAYSI